MSQPISPSKRLLKTFSLAAVIFLTVSGGPYGLEPLMQFAGKDGALLLLLIVPLLWDLPTIFVVLELNSLMPVEGGYYKWVDRALGKRWAFYEGWWTWLYSFTDLAIYPVLFVTYAGFFFPSIAAISIPLRLGIVWACAILNILGIVPVGRVSMILTAIILVPFIILFGEAIFSSSFHFSSPSPTLRGIGFSALGMGLYTVMWNFLGWDNTTTYAGEVDKPVRSYLVSTAFAFVLVLVVYLGTILVTQNTDIDFAKLSDSGFPLLGMKIGGQWLGTLLSIGGMASALGIFSAVMLSISRIPKVMADDKLLPQVLCKLHPRFNTPYISIIICATVVSSMVVWTFTELIVIDVILYGAGLFLEFISLIALRIKEPNAPRPFKIPLPIFLLGILLLLPIAVYIIAITGVLSKPDSNHNMIYFALGALLTAELGWQVIRLANKVKPAI
ncbi:MAG TPA: APC family permease [Bacteroidia bacterium]|nr:APC family permease [Bacteroidia bacterium]